MRVIPTRCSAGGKVSKIPNSKQWMALFDCHHSWGHTLAAQLTCHCSLKAPLKLDRTAHIPSSPTVLRSTSHQGCLPIHPSLLPHYIIPPPFSASSFPSFEHERDGFHPLSLSLSLALETRRRQQQRQVDLSQILSPRSIGIFDLLSFFD